QAEDGIRGRTVTGVQTCALPISAKASVISSATASIRARRWQSIFSCPTRASRRPALVWAPGCERMSTLLVTHSACLEHLTPLGHPERPDRLRAIERVLEHERFATLARERAPRAAPET